MKIIRGRSGSPSQNRGGTTFTGDVWAESVLPTTDGTTVNTVTFLPGSRTHWHSHEHGQLLQVVQGEGLVCSFGGPPVVIRPGDTIWVPAGERHWHGAGPDSLLTHVAISLGKTSWEHEVSEAEYRAEPDDNRSTERTAGKE
jgi:quercetin dioxygenase-like cupin family protein